MIGLGYALGRLIGWSRWESLLMGSVVAISGAVIMAKAIEEVPIDARVRELVFGVVLCEDVIAIMLLAVLITMAHGGEVSVHALSTTASLLSSFIIVVILFGLLTVPRLVRSVARLKRPETLLIVSLGLCFTFAVIAERAGYSVALGAFLAGSLVAESGRAAEIDELVKPVRHLFGAMFFVSVGMLIDPPLLAAHWRLLLILSALVVVGKIFSVTLASLFIGERPNTAVKAGFAMAQIGVFSFLIADVGAVGNSSRELLYSLAVGVTTITAFLCPFLIRASNPVADWLDRKLPEEAHNAVSQYNGWLERIRNPPEAED
jgi:CPA2 family monovalent cation:H+ antiporter-2